MVAEKKLLLSVNVLTVPLQHAGFLPACHVLVLASIKARSMSAW